MKGLVAVFKMRFGLVLNYRMAAIAGLGTQLFFGFVLVMIYDAFFRSQNIVENSQSILPMTIVQTVTYIWLGQAFLGLLPWNGDRDIQSMIRNGDFVYEMVRPLDMYNYWLYRIIAQRIATTLLRSIPLFFIALFIMPKELRMSAPDNLPGFLMFVFTMFGGVILGGTISNIITISVLFTIGDGIERLLPAIVMMFSGMVIPLAFFPDWSWPILKFLPFSSLADAPYKFYLGMYGLSDLLYVIIHQLIWTLAIFAMGKWMIYKASCRIVVQGG